MCVTHDSDNLARSFSKGGACTRTNEYSIFERIAVGPVLPGHGLIDNGNARYGSIVLLRKAAATQERDLESIEIAR
jgi:hypothetical protein